MISSLTPTFTPTPSHTPRYIPRFTVGLDALYDRYTLTGGGVLRDRLLPLLHWVEGEPYAHPIATFESRAAVVVEPPPPPTAGSGAGANASSGGDGDEEDEEEAARPPPSRVAITFDVRVSGQLLQPYVDVVRGSLESRSREAFTARTWAEAVQALTRGVGGGGFGVHAVRGYRTFVRLDLGAATAAAREEEATEEAEEEEIGEEEAGAGVGSNDWLGDGGTGAATASSSTSTLSWLASLHSLLLLPLRSSMIGPIELPLARWEHWRYV